MDATNVAVATGADRERVMQTVTLGFIGDPVSRWIWPDATTYLDSMPRFAAAFAGKALDIGSAYVADAYKVAALWLPPGVEPDHAVIEALFQATVAPDISADLEALFAQMDAYHQTAEPCWYLPMIAADPGHTGKGLGEAILAPALRRCDEEGAAAYLESSNPRNLSLYARHGFKVMGEIQAGSSPTMYPMIRQPRRRHGTLN